MFPQQHARRGGFRFTDSRRFMYVRPVYQFFFFGPARWPAGNHFASLKGREQPPTKSLPRPGQAPPWR